MNKGTELKTIAMPTRIVRDWDDSVMRHCDYCSHYELTVMDEDGAAICAGCCDAEHEGNLQSVLQEALERNVKLKAWLEQAQQDSELQSRTIANLTELWIEGRNRIAELEGEFFALPPLNDDLIAILGRPNFTCAHLAELLRKGGQDIRRKSEFEQAAVIYWFLDLYLKYGDKWESIAKDDIQARVALLAGGTVEGSK